MREIIDKPANEEGCTLKRTTCLWMKSIAGTGLSRSTVAQYRRWLDHSNWCDNTDRICCDSGSGFPIAYIHVKTLCETDLDVLLSVPCRMWKGIRMSGGACSPEAKSHLLRMSNGDARSLLNAIELQWNQPNRIQKLIQMTCMLLWIPFSSAPAL
jgi:hypothetical protein